MEISLIVFMSLTMMILLVGLGVETALEFIRMDKDPNAFSGSDRWAGTAE